MGNENLSLHGLFAVQERRAFVYRTFQEGFQCLLGGGDEASFNALCVRITEDFKKCSDEVNAVEGLARERGQVMIADMIRKLQTQEKEKLRLTAIHQVLRKSLRPSDRPPDVQAMLQNVPAHAGCCAGGYGHIGTPLGSDDVLTMGQLDNEYDLAVQEVTRALELTVAGINDTLEELRYEVVEEDA
eukprot:jgi/Mesvir1/28940/Mv17723-RA.1